MSSSSSRRRSAPAVPPEPTQKIDDDLYSRQRYVLGDKAMHRMAAAHVLVSGLGGVGVEIAKNVALAGVKSLHLHDTKTAMFNDLSTQFYLSKDDVGKNRAAASQKSIAQLNPYVPVRVRTEKLGVGANMDWLKEFACVVVTDISLDDAQAVNAACRQAGVKFIYTDARGVFTWAFVDFGKGFEIFDKNGEEPLEVVLGNITIDTEGVVTTLDPSNTNYMHGFETGDTVTFREIQGTTPLNGAQRKIKVLSPYKFSIGDTTGLPAYIRGGIATQVKVPFTVDHRPLADALRSPSFVVTDFAKTEVPSQLLAAVQGLDAFAKAHDGSMPPPWNEDAAAEVISGANAANAARSTDTKLEKVDIDIARALAFTAVGGFAPLTAFMGGVIAQEVLKALSGKFSPLEGWMVVDAMEALPSMEKGKFSPVDFGPSRSHGDGLRACIGSKLMEKLADSKVFIVGAGAIGCELLKNLALMDIATGPNGLVTITDPDHIEKSNLSRQFLFRNHDLQKPKSSTGAAAAVAMNPALKIKALEHRVGEETEDTFTDAFWEEQTVVLNALDNVKARLYVDSRCVRAQRPLLESGTLGTKGHVQTVVPFLSESYGSARDPPEKDVPYCTLKSFPSQVEHTIQWARDKFQRLFFNKPAEVNSLWDDAEFMVRLRDSPAQALSGAKAVVKITTNRPKNWQDCVDFARIKFEKYFNHKIRQLLHVFPVDLKMKDGTPFWTLPKRAPTPLTFSTANKDHVNFVIATANLWASVFGIKEGRTTDAAAVIAAVGKTKVPAFVLKADKKVETDESAKAPGAEAPTDVNDSDVANVTAQLEKIKAGTRINTTPEEFEKDDDTNHHIDFIHACAMLRAANYEISPVDRLKTKLIAGKIVMAIVTTTAAVSGLVLAETVKLMHSPPLKLEAYKNCFMNLAFPYVGLAEPAPAPKSKINESLSTTLWDRWDVQGNAGYTLANFIAHFADTYKLRVVGVFNGTNMIYTSALAIYAKRTKKKMEQLLKKSELPESTKYINLIVAFQDEAGVDVEGPAVRYHF